MEFSVLCSLILKSINLLWDNWCFVLAELRSIPKITQNLQYGTESIEWFIEDQALLRSCRMIPLLAHPFPPLPSASCLSFTVILCVAGRAYRSGEGVGEEANHTTARNPGPLQYKSFKTLCYGGTAKIRYA
jgi:hypothetical protein